jgi:molecular chaperone GrpE
VSHDDAVPNDASDGPVVRDKRRLDPETGRLRDEPVGGEADVSEPADADAEAELLDAELTELEVGLTADLTVLHADLAERTADLQRLHAEYANYRKRVDRDREVARESAMSAALGELLPVLDDIGRAREHGELEGAFKAVGESLEAVVRRLGLERFGDVGDPFDPTVHEAFTHSVDPSVDQPTCVGVFRPGYRFAGRIVRPAQVAVAEPE